MTDIEKVGIDLEETPIVVKAKGISIFIVHNTLGHDCLSLLYDVLNEFLCANNTKDLLIRDVRAITVIKNEDFSSLRLVGFGEKYNPEKHAQGTEIKAITYSNMQVHVTPEETNIYVILDISDVC